MAILKKNITLFGISMDFIISFMGFTTILLDVLLQPLHFPFFYIYLIFITFHNIGVSLTYYANAPPYNAARIMTEGEIYVTSN